MKSYFISQHHVLKMFHEDNQEVHSFEMARIKVIQSQRKKLLDLWKRQEIDDQMLVHLENELDMEEVHIARAELK